MILVEIQKASRIVKELIKQHPVRIISHYDADGITSAAILTKSLAREGANFEVHIVKQLREKVIKNLLKDEKNSLLIFSDLGSGQLNLLNKYGILENNKVLILDHHQPINFSHKNLIHINSLMFNEPYTSGSILSFLFAYNLNEKNIDLIDLALVGAVGDAIDEKWELKGLSRKVLEWGVRVGKIKVEKGLRLYGRHTRPVHKALYLSTDPYIPGISGSESNAVQLLAELGIPIKVNGRWRMLKDLTMEEQMRLASAIIVERMRGKYDYPEDIFGEIYTIAGRKDELSDAREFATLINACSRLGFYDVALSLCYNDEKALEKARRLMREYRSMLNEYIRWVENNIENPEVVRKTENSFYIFGHGKVRDTMIGTLVSVLSSSSLLNRKLVFGFANTDDNMVKVSARCPREVNLNIRDILIEATRNLSNEAGGHEKAGGATIPPGKEEEFIRRVEKIVGGKIASSKR
ncbi:MAG: DHH family phosphoesterase [Candidatus Aenigmarchaeota archaeon]|nr:DHH family phosphoesterase [Candidatus Aenigmarchaeota archaeon]